MNLLFFDINQAMVDAWQDQVDNDPTFEGTTVVRASLDEVMDQYEPGVVSSAGNSYGIMGAGIDGALRTKWPEAQAKVQSRIAGYPFYGEMPVGSPSILVPVFEQRGGADEQVSTLAYTPTMPRPGTRPLPTISVYFAMRGLMIATRDLPLTVAVPGMGTGIGGIAVEDAAKAQFNAVRSLRREPR